MAEVTYFVVQPFVMRRGQIAPAGQPHQLTTEGAARRLAARLGLTHPAVLAFSRTGDPSTGDWQDAVLLVSYGEIPEEALEAMAA